MKKQDICLMCSGIIKYLSLNNECDDSLSDSEKIIHIDKSNKLCYYDGKMHHIHAGYEDIWLPPICDCRKTKKHLLLPIAVAYDDLICHDVCTKYPEFSSYDAEYVKSISDLFRLNAKESTLYTSDDNGRDYYNHILKIPMNNSTDPILYKWDLSYSIDGRRYTDNVWLLICV